MTGEPEATLHALGARIDTLEMKVTYQDEVIEQLNTVVVGHAKILDQVLGRIARLESRLRDLLDAAGQDASEEPPPPHY